MEFPPLYIVDDENVSFQPRNCNEAIILFNRMRRKNQINWEYVPETLQRLASKLNEEEHDRFCQWVCNPTEIKPGPPGYFQQLQREDAKREETQETETDDEKAYQESSASSHQTPANHSTPCDTSSGNAGISVAPDTPPAPAEL